ncbi:hypothetical protein GCM10023116_30940 [Kistimonas scapharcae]|uniref:Transcriptional regulator n=1 Tax=Kistimonas scapharcae TaxID=1036133 RepID=A0ABP8V699_9GAMM
MTTQQTIPLAGDGNARDPWVAELERVSQTLGQGQVARKLGYSSGSIVSQILKGTYKGRIDTFKERFEGAFMGLCVDCPALGMEIRRDKCLAYQNMAFAATNPNRAVVYRTCRHGRCPHSRVAVQEVH